jgi:T-complex protein 1 subunit beta
MLMAMAVDKEAALTPGKESHAMESFAYALRQLPAIIAENGGFDAAQLVSELRALHAQGKHTVGLGKSGSFSRLVFRPFKIFPARA